MPASSFPVPASAPAGIGGPLGGYLCVSGVDVVVDEDGAFYARELVFGGQSDAFSSGGQFSTVEDAAAMAYAVFQAYLRGVVGVGESAEPADLVRSLRLRFGAR